MTEAILVFDGDCRFCNAWVRFVLRHEAAPVLRFAPLQAAPARRILIAHGVDPDARDAMYLLEDGALSRDSTALWRLGHYLHGLPGLLGWLRWIPRPLRDNGYRLFGRWRYRLFGASAYCSCLAPEQRARFLIHEARR